eukprot:15476147-Alexandrium_andersonii.AAC.1
MLNRPSGWASARSINAALTVSFRRADDAWRRRFELNERREAWIVGLQGHGLDDQVGVRFLDCSDRARQAVIELFEAEPFPPRDRLSR